MAQNVPPARAAMHGYSFVWKMSQFLLKKKGERDSKSKYITQGEFHLVYTS